MLGTFDSVAKTVKATLTESLMLLLSPKRRVDILRDAMHAKEQGRPYVVVFCGVRAAVAVAAGRAVRPRREVSERDRCR